MELVSFELPSTDKDMSFLQKMSLAENNEYTGDTLLTKRKQQLNRAISRTRSRVDIFSGYRCNRLAIRFCVAS